MRWKAAARRATGCALGLSISLVLSEAMATTDGGLIPRLVAFAGEHERWAIVALESVQEPCGIGPCTVVAIDLREATYRERWPFEPYRGQDALSVSELVDAFHLSLVEDAGQLKPARLVEPDAGDPLAVHEGRIVLESGSLAFEEQRRVASMRPFSRGTQKSCGMFSGGDRCSSCEEKAESINGGPLTMWMCDSAPGTFERAGTVCDCHAEGAVFALTGAGFVGREIVVAPYRLAQNVMNGPGIEPDIAVTLAESDARQHRSARGVPLVLAGAVHAPLANGTWFPLVAYRPDEVAVSSPQPATPMTPGAGRGVSIEVRPPPKAGGCAGCAVPSTAGDPPCALPIGVLIAFLGRRRRRETIS